MDAGMASAIKAAEAGNEVGIKMLKKSQDMAKMEGQLVENLTPQSSINKAGQGGGIDVTG